MRVRVHADVLDVLSKKQSLDAPGMRRAADKGGILYYAAFGVFVPNAILLTRYGAPCVVKNLPCPSH